MKDVISVDKAIIDYRIKCDMAVSDREELLISQEEYEKAIQFSLNRSKEALHSLLISKLPEKIKLDESQGFYSDEYHKYVAGHNETIDEMRKSIDGLFGVENGNSR